MKVVTLRLTERQKEMIEEIKKKAGFATTSALIQAALDRMHSGYFPAYKQSFVGEKAEDPAKIMTDEQLCEAIGGEVLPQGRGCKVSRSQDDDPKKGSFSMTFPLGQARKRFKDFEKNGNQFVW